MVVLLAEDDVQLQYFISKLLQADGFTVLNAANGELALEASRSHPGPIELLLTDIQMPRMDGLELSRNIRAERPGIKVLVMSGDLRGREHAALNGLLYLQKPFTLAALWDSIAALLGQIPPLKQGSAGPTGAKDRLVPSGLAIDSNDPLTRRDEGLEFLDVTSQAAIERIGSNTQGGQQTDEYTITNVSASVVDTNLLIIVLGLSNGIQLENASGTTHNGDPYIRVFLPDGVLQPGQNIVQTLIFKRPGGNNAPPVSYSLDLLSGQGNP